MLPSVARAVALILCLILSPRASAQAKEGNVQPNRLPLGIVRVGATVEASFRVFLEGNDISKLGPKVTSPPLVQIKNVTLDTQDFGGRTMIVCDVIVAIDTRQPGRVAQTIEVEVGKHKVKLPVDVTILKPEAGQTRLLIVESPFDKYSTGNADIFLPWLKIVESANLDVHYWLVERKTPVLRDKLAQFDVVLIAESGLTQMQRGDVKALRSFAESGGRVVVAASSFYVGTVPKANELLTPYGLKMLDVEPAGGFNKFEVTGDDVANDGLTKGVKKILFDRFSPTEITDAKSGRVLIAGPTYPGKAFVAAARAGKGEVISLGSSLWWAWTGREQYQNSDNARLLENLLAKKTMPP